MCAAHPPKQHWYKPNLFLAIGLILGLFAGLWSNTAVTATAQTISDIFMSLLKLVSLPIIFLSIVATASGMESLAEIKKLGGRTIKYTFLTTILAATVGLMFFMGVNPVRVVVEQGGALPEAVSQSKGYLSHLLQAVPSNFFKPFVENNVISVLILAILFSLSILSLPHDNRQLLHKVFHSLFLTIMQLTKWIVYGMPLAIWAFVVLFVNDLRSGLEVESLIFYLFCVIMANVVQAAIVLPLFLKWKGISPSHLFKAMFPALSVAFFTKSSGATLPTAMQCATERGGIDRRVASFSLPLCTSINMNGCAAFILITVLFVSMSNGMTYTAGEMVLWIFISTIAAVGNAGVPMGCYFLASAFLATMNVPLYIMGVILPFYTFIDMLETSINVWSDACVTAVVDKEVKEVESLAARTVAEAEFSTGMHYSETH